MRGGVSANKEWKGLAEFVDRINGKGEGGMPGLAINGSRKRQVLEFSWNKRVEGRRSVVGTDQKLKWKTVGAKKENC